jgi:hypothetical protein
MAGAPPREDGGDAWGQRAMGQSVGGRELWRGNFMVSMWIVREKRGRKQGNRWRRKKEDKVRGE